MVDVLEAIFGFEENLEKTGLDVLSFDELIDIFEDLVQGKIHNFVILDFQVLFFRLKVVDAAVGDLDLNHIFVHLVLW